MPRNAETLTFRASGATSFVPGPYQAELVKIERKYKVVTNDEGEREDRPYLRWIFAIKESGYEEKTLSVLSSTSFGVGPTGPSKARRFAEAILGRELDFGEEFTADDLYGKPCIVHVDNERTSRGTFARIVEVEAATDTKKATQKEINRIAKAKEAEQKNQEEIGEIPF